MNKLPFLLFTNSAIIDKIDLSAADIKISFSTKHYIGGCLFEQKKSDLFCNLFVFNDDIIFNFR